MATAVALFLLITASHTATATSQNGLVVYTVPQSISQPMTQADCTNALATAPAGSSCVPYSPGPTPMTPPVLPVPQ